MPKRTAHQGPFGTAPQQSPQVFRAARTLSHAHGDEQRPRSVTYWTVDVGNELGAIFGRLVEFEIFRK